MATVMNDPHIENTDDQKWSKLEQNVILLSPSLGFWRGLYKLDTDYEVSANGKALDKKSVTRPSVKLMTDTYPTNTYAVPYKKLFQALETRLKNIKDKYSLPFPITGVRIVPKARVVDMLEEMHGLTLGTLRAREQHCLRRIDEYSSYDPMRHVDENGTSLSQDEVIDIREKAEDELEQIRNKIRAVHNTEGVHADNSTPVYDESKETQSVAYELHCLANEFCNRWDRIKEEIAREDPTTYNQVKDKLAVSGQEIRSKFHLDVVPVELAGSRANRVNQDTIKQGLEEHAQLVRDACRRKVEAAVEEMIRAPREQLADAMASLKDLVERRGRVTVASFSPIREAIAKIRAFEFVANADLLNKIKELEDSLNISPKDLRESDSAAKGFSAALDSYMDEVTSEERTMDDLARFGREARGLDL